MGSVLLNHSWKHTESLANWEQDQMKGNKTLTRTNRIQYNLLKISIDEKTTTKRKRSQLQQLTDVSTGNRHDQSWVCQIRKNCRSGEEIEKKVKLYAEVEFSAQGYDTHTHLVTSRQDAKGRGSLLSELYMFHLRSHHSWPHYLSLGCMHTHIQ